VDCAYQFTYVLCLRQHICVHTNVLCNTMSTWTGQKPMSAWALKLKEEQKAFAEAMSSMKGINDD
jgi:hypothetical protein